MKKFPKKRIAITGAGSGIGRALALEFAGHGWRVASNDIDLAAAEETMELVRKAGGDGLAVKCDVTRIDELESLAALLDKEWDGVDIFVNNAGVASGGFMEDHPLEDWEWVLNVNLMGMVHGCKVFTPVLQRQGRGHLVNVASAAGLVSLAEMSIYNVSKAAVVSLSETLRSELAPRNIGVTVLCPSFFKTNLLGAMRTTHERQLKMAQKAMELSTTTAEDVARQLYKDVLKDKMYSIAMKEIRSLWRIKRFFPERYFKMMSKNYRNGGLDERFELKNEFPLEKYKPVRSE
ncbi:MAG: SDR family oxidoreductase [Proteobacteria bacterium]|nr:SDR family oxidoreductase [Pseudomonadota bacterium]